MVEAWILKGGTTVGASSNKGGFMVCWNACLMQPIKYDFPVPVVPWMIIRSGGAVCFLAKCFCNVLTYMISVTMDSIHNPIPQKTPTP